MTVSNANNPPPPHTPLLVHDLVTMCYYQPIFFECPTCHNVLNRGGEDIECEDYVQTRDREMTRMKKWREGSQERAPPTPFIFGWCIQNGNTDRDPVAVVSGKACGTCMGAGWSGESSHSSPTDSEASMTFTHNGYLSPHVQVPLTPLTSIEDELDGNKMELDFPMLDAPSKQLLVGISIRCLIFSCIADSRGRPVRQSERIRAREEKKAGTAAQTRTTEAETRGRPPTSTRRR